MVCRCRRCYLSQRFRAATTALGRDLNVHGLRHGFATLALASGTDLKVTQGLMGHSTYHITADLYHARLRDGRPRRREALGRPPVPVAVDGQVMGDSVIFGPTMAERDGGPAT
jgi:integrase